MIIKGVVMDEIVLVCEVVVVVGDDKFNEIMSFRVDKEVGINIINDCEVSVAMVEDSIRILNMD